MSSHPHREHRVTDEHLAARRHLDALAANDMPRLPWMAGKVPHDDITLIRYFIWRANNPPGVTIPDDVYAALRLVDSARAELDALEAGLLFIARAEGLTWAQIAEHLGVRSPQAAQQRLDRVASRTETTNP